MNLQRQSGPDYPHFGSQLTHALHLRGQQVPSKWLPNIGVDLRFPVSSIDPFPYGYNHPV